MRIGLITYGSRGDVLPFARLARRLKAQGHEPVLCVPPNLQAAMASPGVTLAPIGEDSQALLQAKPLVGQGFFASIDRLKTDLGEQSERLLTGALAAVEGVELVVGGGAQAISDSVAERLGVPYVFAALYPSLIRSLAFPPPGVLEQRRRFGRRFAWWTYERVLRAIFERPLSRARAQVGLPPIDLRRRPPAELTLVACDPELSPPPPDWRMPFEITGFWYGDERPALSPEVQAFLAAGPKPVYVGFGSMTTDRGPAVAAAVDHALAQVGARAVVAAGWGRLFPERAGCLVVDEAPHEALFPHVAATIHHGGAGTTAAALKAGVPQVIVPHQADQFYWGHRVAEVGVGWAGPPVTKLTGPRLAEALGGALTSKVASQAAAMGARVSARDGVQVAVDALVRRFACPSDKVRPEVAR